MDALNDALREAVTAGTLTRAEYDEMAIPTWNRTLAEFTAPFDDDALGLDLVEQGMDTLPDQYLADWRTSGNADSFGEAVSGFLRAFTEPSLFETLDRPEAERAALADRVYEAVRARATADPAAMETTWHVAVLRVAKV